MDFITRAPTLDEFKDLLGYNEPSFGYKGKEYSICSPDGKYYVWSEGNESDTELEFETVDDMLNGWVIQGKTLREALPDIEMDFPVL